MGASRIHIEGRLGKRPILPSGYRREPGEDLVPQTSVVNVDSAESVSVATLVHRLGRLGNGRMRRICGALETAVACDS